MTPLIWWHGGDFPLRNLLTDPLMWPCLIEILDKGMQDTMQLLFMKDQDVVQTLPPNAPQKAFTDRIGSWRLIRCFKYLDATCDRCSSETGSEFAIMIADEILRRLSIRSRFP